jgi:inosine-uridine nucleoside N-ribohydrolase
MLVLAMNEIELVQIIATDGNCWAEEVLENIRSVLTAWGRPDLPVALIPFPHRFRHRARAYRAYRQGHKSFLGPYLKSERPRSPEATEDSIAKSISAFAAAIEGRAGDVVIMSLGPLFPLAALIKQYPHSAAQIRHVVAMAGKFAAGDRHGTRADFNVWFDPASARTVFRSGLEILLLPRNACEGCCIDPVDLAGWAPETPWRRRFIADIAGMLAQHGQDFPLIDTLVPLVLTEPDLVARLRRGEVHVRRKPLQTSGQTYFRECEAGNVLVIEELRKAKVPHSLLRRVDGLDEDGGAPIERPRHCDFPARTWMAQRLFDRTFHQIELDEGRECGGGAKELDLEGLDQLYRATLGLVPDANGLKEEAELLARFICLDAVATWSTSGVLAGIVGLSLATERRRIVHRRAGLRLSEGDAIVELARMAPGADPTKTTNALIDALTAWWRQTCERKGIVARSLHCLSIGVTKGPNIVPAECSRYGLSKQVPLAPPARRATGDAAPIDLHHLRPGLSLSAGPL